MESLARSKKFACSASLTIYTKAFSKISNLISILISYVCSVTNFILITLLFSKSPWNQNDTNCIVIIIRSNDFKDILLVMNFLQNMRIGTSRECPPLGFLN